MKSLPVPQPNPRHRLVSRVLAPFLATAAIILACLPALQAGEVLSLAGTWRLALDPSDLGLQEQWQNRHLQDRVRLPGSLPQQDIGDPITTETPWTGGIVDRSWFTSPEYAADRMPGAMRVPFWLQPRTYYAGAAWYQRDVEIPVSWRDQPLLLHLERPHWETRVWIDDRLIGTAQALGTPHSHLLGLLSPGRHRLTIRVDNRLVVDIGHDSHSVSDHTQGNWNGIVGRIEIRALGREWFDDLQVYPQGDPQPTTVMVRGRLRVAQGAAGSPSVLLQVTRREEPSASDPAWTREAVVEWADGIGHFQTTLSLGPDAPTWDEFHPRLLRLRARTVPGAARRETTFGLRTVGTRGTQFLVNGRKTFLRGTLECSIFPKTGHPPVEVEEWRRIMRILKAHGLNHLRFHSHCPPEAAFVAADQLGVYLQVEASSWANASTTLGDGKPVDRWVQDETARILHHYGNHPSFLLMAYGNEPGGPRHRAFLADYVTRFRNEDPRRLWTSAAGWPELPENQWHSSPDPRIHAWGAGLASRINARPPETTTDYRAFIEARSVPVISHEIGQWCAYPNFDEIRKYSGYLKPRNFEIFRDRLIAHGLGDLARPFLHASGRLQVLCYKEEIESTLRTPGMGGFQLLDLHDFPGQGTALVGMLDPFWDSKGYLTSAEFRRWSGPTVPLARLPRRVFTSNDSLVADLEAAHFGPNPIPNARISWRLVDRAGRIHLANTLPPTTLPVDNGIRLGRIEVPLRNLPAPAQVRLVVRVEDPNRPAPNRRAAPDRAFENDWNLWIYPASLPPADTGNLLITPRLDDHAERVLAAGGRVFWNLPPATVSPDPVLGPIALGFSPIFWNTAWTRRQAPHTLGILCDPRHPLFDAFPTDSHSDWQWWSLLRHAAVLRLDALPVRLRPTLQVIDDWVTARRLGLVFEARVGPGRLLVCSMDLETDLESDPARRQFRHSLLRYLSGNRFRPAVSASIDQLRQLQVSP